VGLDYRADCRVRGVRLGGGEEVLSTTAQVRKAGAAGGEVTSPRRGAAPAAVVTSLVLPLLLSARRGPAGSRAPAAQGETVQGSTAGDAVAGGATARSRPPPPGVALEQAGTVPAGPPGFSLAVRRGLPLTVGVYGVWRDVGNEEFTDAAPGG